MTPAQANTRNVTNSVSTYLAVQLLALGYVIYWHQIDAVQTQDGWYLQYNTNRASYLQDGTFLARYNAAPALVTLTDAIPANPRHIIRPTTDGSVGAAEAVTLPVLSVSVATAVPEVNWELGSNLKLRSRHLVIDGLLRSREELEELADALAVMFDEDLVLNVYDHSGGTMAVWGTVVVVNQRVDRAIWPEEVEEKRFQVLLNARLEYVA